MNSLDKSNEKGGKFLAWFWDLASEDSLNRQDATKNIIFHLENSTKCNETKKICADIDYALKRLVRGLSSSRESARQGFAVCLCQVLRTFEQIDLIAVMGDIDEATKVSGSMKGSEERELIFGKLFGYLSIIRSNRLINNQSAIEKVRDILLELLYGKPWIKESVIEAILSLIDTLSPSDFSLLFSSKFQVLFADLSLNELNADHVTLLFGLQHYIQNKNESIHNYLNFLNDEILEFLSSTSTTITSIEHVLIASCAGYPKIHRIWTYLLGNVFGLSKERQLPMHRCKSLTTKQEFNLTQLINFIDTDLFSSTQERRSVGIHLITELVQRTPSELLPLALSKVSVRCLLSCRKNKKHTLYNIAEIALVQIVKCVESDPMSKLALASVIIQYGGANFDGYTSTTTISQLLEGLGYEAVGSHIRFLCGSLNSTLSTKQNNDNNNNQVEVQDEDEVEENMTSALSTVEAMSSLIRNSKLTHRGNIIMMVIGVLIRICCFSNGRLIIPKINPIDDTTTTTTTTVSTSVAAAAATPSKKKKNSKNTSVVKTISEQDKKDLILLELIKELPSGVLEAIQLVEGGDNTSSSSNNNGDAMIFPNEIIAMASNKLLSTLADYGHISFITLNKPISTGNVEGKGEGAVSSTSTSTEVNSGPTILDMTMKIMSILTTMNINYQRDNNNENDNESDNESTAVLPLKNLFESIQNLIKNIESSHISEESFDLLKIKEKDSNNNDNKNKLKANNKNKLASSLLVLLKQLFFFTISTDSLEVEIIQQLIEIIPRLLSNENKSQTKPKTTNNNDSDNDDEEDEEESAQVVLLDITLDILSVPVDCVVKGIRDALKRVWMSLNTCGVDIEDDVIGSLGAMVAGEAMEEEDEENENGGNNENDDDGDKMVVDNDDNDSDDDESDNKDSNKNKKNKNEKNKKKDVEDNNNKNDDDNDDDEEDEDIILTEDQALQMLTDENDDDDNNDNDQLQHFEGADDALVEMLKQRRQIRKSGIRDALRYELLNRTRAMDILDIIMNKCDRWDIAYTLMLSLLRCLKKLHTSVLVQGLAEGKALEMKIKSFIEQKIAKKRLIISETDIDEVSTEFLSSIPTILITYLTGTNTSTRAAATECFLCYTKTIISQSDSTLKDKLSATVHDLLMVYMTKRGSKTPVKLFDELIQRFTDFFTIHIIKCLVTTTISAKNEYLKMDSFRLLTLIFKRFSSLSEDSKRFICTHIDSILVNMKKILEDADNKDTATHRFKHMFHCIKDIIQVLKLSSSTQSISSSLKQLNNLKITIESVKIASTSATSGTTTTTSGNSQATQMYTQLISSITEFCSKNSNTTTVTTTSNNTKKSNKKDNINKNTTTGTNDNKNSTLDTTATAVDITPLPIPSTNTNTSSTNKDKEKKSKKNKVKSHPTSTSTDETVASISNDINVVSDKINEVKISGEKLPKKKKISPIIELNTEQKIDTDITTAIQQKKKKIKV